MTRGRKKRKAYFKISSSTRKDLMIIKQVSGPGENTFQGGKKKNYAGRRGMAFK